MICATSGAAAGEVDQHREVRHPQRVRDERARLVRELLGRDRGVEERDGPGAHGGALLGEGGDGVGGVGVARDDRAEERAIGRDVAKAIVEEASFDGKW